MQYTIALVIIVAMLALDPSSAASTSAKSSKSEDSPYRLLRPRTSMHAKSLHRCQRSLLTSRAASPLPSLVRHRLSCPLWSRHCLHSLRLGQAYSRQPSLARRRLHYPLRSPRLLHNHPVNNLRSHLVICLCSLAQTRRPSLR